jgi:hypothetical protein
MAATFKVDDVVRAAVPLPARRLADALGEVLALGGDPNAQVVEHGPAHPLLGAVHLAFAQHRPLILSPDAVWLTIAQGIAHHVRLHAEELRPRLVRHPGTKTLVITQDSTTMPTDAVGWAEIAGRFRDAIANEVGEGRARLLECDFSTTTEVERVASRIVLMDVYAPYFDYLLACVCGIPEVTLLGTVDDWKKIRSRLDVVAELGLETWVRSLALICDELVRAAGGDPDPAFWKRIYKPRDAYGEEVITGWIARLYPYLESAGTVSAPNPLLELPIDEPRDAPAGPRWYNGPGIRASAVPSTPATARVTVVDVKGARREVALQGGVLAVAQDDAGRLAPISAWTLRPSEPAISVVVEQIRTAHAFVPSSSRDGDDPIDVDGPADFVGLYHELEEATLFAPGRHWRIRPRSQHPRIIFDFDTSDRWGTIVERFIDLPDGTFIGLAVIQGGSLFVRGRVDRLQAIDESAEIRRHDQRSSQPSTEVPVLRGRLAEILAAALDSGGAEPAENGTMADVLRSRVASTGDNVVAFRPASGK